MCAISIDNSSLLAPGPTGEDMTTKNELLIKIPPLIL